MSTRREAVGELGRGLAGLLSGGSTLKSFIRPPGALAERAFLSACDGCGACVDACPHAAIGVLPPTAGPASNTPAMLPEQRPCHLCADAPCVSACDRGALMPIGEGEFFFGIAEIEQGRCFAFQGPECGSCAASCPTKAIETTMGRPAIDEAACVGCGLCREACPVWGKAIRVL